jgi:hypothetical protein
MIDSRRSQPSRACVRFGDVRRLAVLLLAVTALAAPATTAAAQPPPADPATPTFAGRPYLVREDGARVTLYLRLERAIPPRFDGEIPATAQVDGRRSSLAALPGTGTGAACYSAAVRLDGDDASRLGSRHTVALVLDGAPAASVTRRVRLRGSREGDARGAPLAC